jgi:Protein of unknown function (DUF4238)
LFYQAGMTDQRTKRMHTVPQGYFEAFAVQDPTRRTSGVWRFDRLSGTPKVLGISDVEVTKDIYTVFGKDGAPDDGIDGILCNQIEGPFCTSRTAILNRAPLSKELYAALFRFVAAQLLRTPRVFQLMRDGLDADGTAYEQDALPGVMLILIERWIQRLARMRGILAFTETGLPLLTSDNPAVAWKRSGEGFTIGVDQYDSQLVVSCPLSPSLLYTAYQTPESLEAVHAEQHDEPRAERQPQAFRAHIGIGGLPENEVKRLNLLCVSNAQRYIYANYCDKALLRFLTNRFIGAAAPVRRRDAAISPGSNAVCRRSNHPFASTETS